MDMKRIGIRELHLKTGEWVRRAALGDGVITERGRPVASLLPVRPSDLSTSFAERCMLPEFDALPEVSGDSGVYVSDDRDRGRPAPAAGVLGRNVIRTE